MEGLKEEQPTNPVAEVQQEISQSLPEEKRTDPQAYVEYLKEHPDTQEKIMAIYKKDGQPNADFGDVLRQACEIIVNEEGAEK